MSVLSSDVRCKRISRICGKITDLLNNEMEGDMDEFMTNIQSVFLVLCAYLHTDIDYSEMFAGESGNPDIYAATHASVEDMYKELGHTLSKIQKSLACDKYGWFNESEDHHNPKDHTCTESQDASSRFQSMLEGGEKLNFSAESSEILLQGIVSGLKKRMEEDSELSVFRVVDPDGDTQG